MRHPSQETSREKESRRKLAPYGWKDPNGRLLEIRRGDRFVYRAVGEESYRIFSVLSSSGRLQTLQEQGLVPTDEAAFSYREFHAVLRHERVPFVSLPDEWTLGMLRDAGLLLCTLAEELAGLDLCLQDGHPWNVTFRATQPVFLDWGSIVPADPKKHRAWLHEYRKHVILPLWLSSVGLADLAYASLRERRGGAVKTLFQRRFARWVPLSMVALRWRLRRGSFAPVVGRIARLTERLGVTSDKTVWSDYDQTSYPYKERAFEEFLAGLAAGETVIDIGANKGHHTLACARAGHPAVALDADPNAVEILYQQVRKTGENVLPLRVDLLQPTPNYGPELAEPEIFDRLRCDHGLALALSHHLAHSHGLPFDVLARILARYVRRSLLVEYIDPADLHLKGWQRKGWTPPDWYSAETFVESFLPHFELAKSWRTDKDDAIQRTLFHFVKGA